MSSDLYMNNCAACGGRCRLYTGTRSPTAEDLREDLVLTQERWHKARREGRYFRAQWWAEMRDTVLDHLSGSPSIMIDCARFL